MGCCCAKPHAQVEASQKQHPSQGLQSAEANHTGDPDIITQDGHTYRRSLFNTHYDEQRALGIDEAASRKAAAVHAGVQFQQERASDLNFTPQQPHSSGFPRYVGREDVVVAEDGERYRQSVYEQYLSEHHAQHPYKTWRELSRERPGAQGFAIVMYRREQSPEKAVDEQADADWIVQRVQRYADSMLATAREADSALRTGNSM